MAYWVSLSRYRLAVSFQTSPNAFSNRRHVALGRYRYGTVESRLAGTGAESKETVLFVDIPCICTGKSAVYERGK